ncbi:Ff.00g042030.m01.CDS01 [Fusarium sp. VM40]|nr:Ff.00g042030.m01.CDS01 [Fusarium sp. VM40]
MSPDFSILASAAIDGSIKFWNTIDGTLIYHLKVEDQNYLHITELKFSHDGRLLLSVAFSGEAWLWDVEERACVHDFTVYDWGFCTATFSIDSRDLIIGCEDGVLRRFEVSTKLIKDLPGHEGTIEVVSMSPDTMLAASGDSVGIVRLWELNRNLCVNELTGHSKGITSIAFSPGSLQLATASLDKAVRLWSVGNGTCMRLLTMRETVKSLAFSPNTLILAAVAANDIIQLWNTEDGDLLRCHKLPRVGACDIKFDSEGKTIFCEAGAISIEQSSSIDERSCSSQDTVAAGFAISRDTQWITWRGDKVLWLPVSPPYQVTISERFVIKPDSSSTANPFLQDMLSMATSQNYRLHIPLEEANKALETYLKVVCFRFPRLPVDKFKSRIAAITATDDAAYQDKISNGLGHIFRAYIVVAIVPLTSDNDATPQGSFVSNHVLAKYLKRLNTKISYDNNGISGILRSPYVFGAALLASFGGISFGYDQGVISIILTMPQFQETFPEIAPGHSRYGFNTGFMTGMLEFGAFFGCLFFPLLADRYSRKYDLAVATVFSCVGAIVQTAAHNYGTLVAGRTIGGVGVGTLAIGAPLYILEIAPLNLRGSLLVLEAISIVIGEAVN